MKKQQDAQKLRKWEKDRRERFNLALDGLAQTLPGYEEVNSAGNDEPAQQRSNAAKWSKVEIVDRATHYIKGLKQLKLPSESNSKVKFLRKQNKKLKELIRQELQITLADSDFHKLDLDKLKEAVRNARNQIHESQIETNVGLGQDVFVAPLRSDDHSYALKVQDQPLIEVDAEEVIEGGNDVEKEVVLHTEEVQHEDVILESATMATEVPVAVPAITTIANVIEQPSFIRPLIIPFVQPQPVLRPMINTSLNGSLIIPSFPSSFFIRHPSNKLPLPRLTSNNSVRTTNVHGGSKSSVNSLESTRKPRKSKYDKYRFLKGESKETEKEEQEQAKDNNSNATYSFSEVTKIDSSLPKAILASEDPEGEENVETIDLTDEVIATPAEITTKNQDSIKVGIKAISKRPNNTAGRERKRRKDETSGSGIKKSKSSYSIAALCQISVNIGGDPSEAASMVNSPGMVSLNSVGTSSPVGTPAPTPTPPCRISSPEKESSTSQLAVTTPTSGSTTVKSKVLQELSPSKINDKSAEKPVSKENSNLESAPTVIKASEKQKQKTTLAPIRAGVNNSSVVPVTSEPPKGDSEKPKVRPQTQDEKPSEQHSTSQGKADVALAELDAKLKAISSTTTEKETSKISKRNERDLSVYDFSEQKLDSPMKLYHSTSKGHHNKAVSHTSTSASLAPPTTSQSLSYDKTSSTPTFHKSSHNQTVQASSTSKKITHSNKPVHSSASISESHLGKQFAAMPTFPIQSYDASGTNVVSSYNRQLSDVPSNQYPTTALPPPPAPGSMTNFQYNSNTEICQPNLQLSSGYSQHQNQPLQSQYHSSHKYSQQSSFAHHDYPLAPSGSSTNYYPPRNYPPSHASHYRYNATYISSESKRSEKARGSSNNQVPQQKGFELSGRQSHSSKAANNQGNNSNMSMQRIQIDRHSAVGMDSSMMIQTADPGKMFSVTHLVSDKQNQQQHNSIKKSSSKRSSAGNVPKVMKQGKTSHVDQQQVVKERHEIGEDHRRNSNNQKSRSSSRSGTKNSGDQPKPLYSAESLISQSGATLPLDSHLSTMSQQQHSNTYEMAHESNVLPKWTESHSSSHQHHSSVPPNLPFSSISPCPANLFSQDMSGLDFSSALFSHDPNLASQQTNSKSYPPPPQTTTKSVNEGVKQHSSRQQHQGGQPMEQYQRGNTTISSDQQQQYLGSSFFDNNFFPIPTLTPPTAEDHNSYSGFIAPHTPAPPPPNLYSSAGPRQGHGHYYSVQSVTASNMPQGHGSGPPPSSIAAVVPTLPVGATSTASSVKNGQENLQQDMIISIPQHSAGAMASTNPSSSISNFNLSSIFPDLNVNEKMLPPNLKASLTMPPPPLMASLQTSSSSMVAASATTPISEHNDLRQVTTPDVMPPTTPLLG